MSGRFIRLDSREKSGAEGLMRCAQGGGVNSCPTMHAPKAARSSRLRDMLPQRHFAALRWWAGSPESHTMISPLVSATPLTCMAG